MTSHPGEDVFELYCLNRLGEDAAAPLEKHLFVCESCQKQVENLDAFLKATRQAARDLQHEEMYRQPALRWSWLRPAWPAACMLAVLTIISVPSVLRRDGQPQAIEVTAYRRVGEATANSGRPLHLNLDLAGISTSHCCVVRLMDSDKAVLAQASVSPIDGKAVLNYSPGLRSGKYWVRVHTKDGRGLREFGLLVR